MVTHLTFTLPHQLKCFPPTCAQYFLTRRLSEYKAKRVQYQIIFRDNGCVEDSYSNADKARS